MNIHIILVFFHNYCLFSILLVLIFAFFVLFLPFFFNFCSPFFQLEKILGLLSTINYSGKAKQDSKDSSKSIDTGVDPTIMESASVFPALLTTTLNAVSGTSSLPRQNKEKRKKDSVQNTTTAQSEQKQQIKDKEAEKSKKKLKNKADNSSFSYRPQAKAEENTSSSSSSFSSSSSSSSSSSPPSSPRLFSSLTLDAADPSFFDYGALPSAPSEPFATGVDYSPFNTEYPLFNRVQDDYDFTSDSFLHSSSLSSSRPQSPVISSQEMPFSSISLSSSVVQPDPWDYSYPSNSSPYSSFNSPPPDSFMQSSFSDPFSAPASETSSHPSQNDAFSTQFSLMDAQNSQNTFNSINNINNTSDYLSPFNFNGSGFSGS